VQTENTVVAEKRKKFTHANSFLQFIPWNIYHLKLLKQKIIEIQATLLHVALLLVQRVAFE
jgi:hypothetical protein